MPPARGGGEHARRHPWIRRVTPEGERARAVGGELEAGPSDDGWRGEARLPVRRHPEAALP